MSAGQLDIIIEQNATFQLPLFFNTQCSDGIPGNPIDVSTWVFSGQIRSTYSSSVVIATFVFTAGDSTNCVIASLSQAVTALLPVYTATSPNLKGTQYVYDINALKPGPSSQRMMEGSVFINPTVTR